ncbi:MAG: hypothetical protein WBB98_01075 [Xanthobacteraceae bacterium]
MSAQVIQISAKTRRQFVARTTIRQLIEGRDAVTFRQVEEAVPGGIGFERARLILKAEGFNRVRSRAGARGDLFRRAGTCNDREERALLDRYYSEFKLPWDRADAPIAG